MSRIVRRRTETAPTRGSERQRGQSLVEFSLILLPFLVLLLGLVDLGRGIYAYNSVSQAAREIARASSFCNGPCDVGTSSKAQAAKNEQMDLVPGLTAAGISVACVDINDEAPEYACQPGDFVRVTVTVSFSPITPIIGQLGPFTLQSVARLQYS